MAEESPTSDRSFRDYPTVQKYISEMVDKRMTEAEQQERLRILAEFCRFVGRAPDQMIAEVFDVATQKYRKRNYYSDQVKSFSAQLAGTWSARSARGNVIRSFFIANGRRLLNDKPDWL